MYDITRERLDLTGGTEVALLSPGIVALYTFNVEKEYRYIDVTVEGRETEKDIVGSLIVLLNSFSLVASIINYTFLINS